MQLNQYWKNILAISDTNDSYLQSLRVHMYLDFQGNRVRLSEQVKILLLIFYQLLKPHRKYPLSDTSGSDYLFYIPFDTPAHKGNMVPLLKIAREKGMKEVLLVCKSKPETIHARDNRVILTGKIPSYVPFRNRFSIISASRKVGMLRRSVRKTHPAWRKEMKNLTLKYIFLIYQSMLHELFFRKLLGENHFKAVISTTEYFPADFQLFNIASGFGIKTFIIQHGIIGPYFCPSQAGYIINWGKPFHEQLIKIGIESSKLHGRNAVERSPFPGR